MIDEWNFKPAFIWWDVQSVCWQGATEATFSPFWTELFKICLRFSDSFPAYWSPRIISVPFKMTSCKNTFLAKSSFIRDFRLKATPDQARFCLISVFSRVINWNTDYLYPCFGHRGREQHTTVGRKKGMISLPKMHEWRENLWRILKFKLPKLESE